MKYLGSILFICSCYINMSAQVGIGTTTPSSTLHITDDSSFTEVKIDHPSQSVLTLQAGSPVLRWSDGNNIKARAQWVKDQLKLFSSPPQGFPISFAYPTLNLSEDRKVGINLGLVAAPTESLEVNGRIKVGFSDEQATEGTFRYDPGTRLFQGFDGVNWLSFTSSIRDKDGDNFVELIEDVNDRIWLRTPGGSLYFDGRRILMGQNYNILIGGTPKNSNNNEYNTVLGSAAGNNMSSGRWNTFTGMQSGFNLSNGTSNSFYGAESGKFSNGYNNTYIGYKAGANNSTGSNNVFIGNRAGEQNNQSNQLIIDNGVQATPLIQGDFSTKEVALNGDLIVNESTFFNAGVVGQSTASFQGQVEASSLKIRNNGSVKYSINYSPTGDKLIIKDENNNNNVFIIENGEVTIPALANGNSTNLKVDSNGKIYHQINPDIIDVFSYQFHKQDYRLYYVIPPEILIGYDNFKSMSLYRDQSPENMSLGLFRKDKDPYINYSLDVLTITSGSYSNGGLFIETDDSALNSEIDTNKYVYFLLLTVDYDNLDSIRKIELIME